MKRTSLGQDSVVLVTGGNKGIGKETAREFCKLGCFVYICGRDKTTLEATKEEFLKDHYSFPYSDDLTSRESLLLNSVLNNGIDTLEGGWCNP